MAYVIAEPCVDVHDRGCVDECPVDCIYDGVRKSYIRPDACVDCGACEPVCPVTAIFHEDELPPEWDAYRRIEQEFFELSEVQAGLTDRACDAGQLALDHPEIGRVSAA
ncbi:MAG TPA: ferredoxin [Actinomycetota bacterium]|jgi:NAD-dependent dihydropyrimidine dehydrogenase PreA subunit|nr:ferredoxin [Actinomycetota bacterium]